MARSLNKGPYISASLYKKIKKTNIDTSIQTRDRRSTIIPMMLGRHIEVYNGKVYKRVYISEDKLGYKLGEFSETRTFRGHAGDKVKNKKK